MKEISGPGGEDMRLRAQIVVDIDANDFMEAAEHQKTLQKYLREIQARYPGATLSIRERRQRTHNDAVPARGQPQLRTITR